MSFRSLFICAVGTGLIIFAYFTTDILNSIVSLGLGCVLIAFTKIISLVSKMREALEEIILDQDEKS